MPIYEYQCQACGDVQEILQRMTDPAPTGCAVCQGGPINKMVSKTAFILKGTGWYVTDFRTKNKGAAGSDVPSAAAAEASRKPEQKADSDSAAPSTTAGASSSTPAAAPAAKSEGAAKSTGSTST